MSSNSKTDIKKQPTSEKTESRAETYDADLRAAVQEVMQTGPSKIVISNRKSRAGAAADLNEARLSEKSAGSDNDNRIYEKIVITPRTIKGELMYQAEQFTRTQAFHKNMTSAETEQYVISRLQNEFRQLDSFSESCDMNIKLSKKGKVMTGRRRTSAAENISGSDMAARSAADAAPQKKTPAKSVPAPQLSVPSHNKRKKRIIEEGTVVPPLVDMGVFTKDGRIVKSMGDKFRQINRFLEIVDDAVDACGFTEMTVIDFGCGKAYLTFILYYYLTYIKKIKATMIGLDLKADVIADCRKTAEKYGYENLHFEVGDISRYTADGPVDMVLTLHACDTATDYALYNAVSWNSKVILSVPCCQHELNSQIKTDELSIFTKYGLIKERFAALATDAVRASLLEHEGYKTQVLEFIDMSHTPKNILIRAVKTNIPASKKNKSLKEVEALIRDFNAEPTLYRLLIEEKQ